MRPASHRGRRVPGRGGLLCTGVRGLFHNYAGYIVGGERILRV